jgi:hypothetical protein
MAKWDDQRRWGRWGDPVTKEIVDCGAGTADEVWFDEGVDDVMDNCEIKHPL